MRVSVAVFQNVCMFIARLFVEPLTSSGRRVEELSVIIMNLSPLMRCLKQSCDVSVITDWSIQRSQ